MISAIIPTYNEADNIGAIVAFLKKEFVSEIIVSDGGSADNTMDVARTAGAIAIVSPMKGRAAQMNFAASIAKSDILYFIHADTFPPSGFTADIELAVKQGFETGRYRTRFNSNKRILTLNAFFTRFDWFICYGGDQTLFITKRLFNAINGFNESMLIMEDYDIVSRAKQFAKYKIFSKAALVSARKYETNSWFKVQMANRTIVQMFKSGASQQQMVSKYKEMLIYR